MPPFLRFCGFSALSALLLAGSAPASLAQEAGPRVEVGPSGVEIVAGDAEVSVGSDETAVRLRDKHAVVRPGSYVLVCANGVRVVVHAGSPPLCPAPAEPPAVDPEPYPEPEPAPEEETPAPAPPEAEPQPAAPPAAAAQPEPAVERQDPPVEPEPSEPAPQESSASPAPPPEVPDQAREQILADLSAPDGSQAAGTFTPMRTMAVIAVIGALAAMGSGRAAARSGG
ncbi:hypothetical protein [Nocardiopsis sp. CNT312]|uniref:hypothetical protein n=1 Tax=Nocardiopsis sp. CNT312 TaxID=1137268 RepID=UPI00048F8DD4|nr:hypothetical protein [Nocardiopsis sp. CNT312]